MKIIETKFPEVIIIEPKIFSDERGFFYEFYQQEKFAELGLNNHFVQDNISHSKKNVLRGMHFQFKQAQCKLVSVLKGAVLDVVVDIRVGSPNFSQWISVELNDKNRRQLYIPEGFAHGFLTLSDEVDFIYKCSDYYRPEYEAGLLWNDPEVSIDWGIQDPILSEKDSKNKKLQDIAVDQLPVYQAVN